MRVDTIMNNALSALQVNQEALRITSANIANVNSPDYARREVEFQARAVGDAIGGVEIGEIKRIVDDFLLKESLTTSSAFNRYDTEAKYHDQLQSLLGSPDQNSSVPGRLADVMSAFSNFAINVDSGVVRTTTLDELQDLLNTISTLGGQVTSMRSEVSRELSQEVTALNEAFEQVSELNAKIVRRTTVGDDPADLLDQRDATVRQIAEKMDIEVRNQPDGSVNLFTRDGFALLSSAFTPILSYPHPNAFIAGTVPDQISVTRINPVSKQTFGSVEALDSHLSGGELRGLINMRDDTLPALAQSLGELGAQVADQINAIHNNNVAYPPPETLTGRNTGLVAADAHNFSGATTLAVAAADGTLVSRIDINFDAGANGEYSVNGGPAVAIGATVGDLQSALNTALSSTGNGTATFSGGVLTLDANPASHGLGFLEDSTSPSSRGGRSLSHFFGLNDLVTGSQPSHFETGIAGTESHGFGAGQIVDFVIRHPDGRSSDTITFTVAGTSFNDLITDLNNPSGLGAYMSFSLSASGELVSTPNAGFEGFEILVKGDGTIRSGSGVSLSGFFGLGTKYQMQQGDGLAVNPTIAGSSNLLAGAQLDLATAVAGDVVVSQSDNRGALALEQLSDLSVSFGSAGHLPAQSATLSEYAAGILADVGAQAAQVDSLKDNAQALNEEVQRRKLEAQGVNMDEELANMIVYQEAYNAAARLISTAQELLDELLSIV